MKVFDTAGIGNIVKARRKALGMTQRQLADVCGSGSRFISDLENGKPTMQIGKVIDVVMLLGIDLDLVVRGA